MRPPREARGHQRSGRPAPATRAAGHGPGRQPPARAITAALAATVLVALAGLVLTGLEWSSLATSDAAGSVGAEAGAIAYAALGALIVRRAGNFVGWFMLAEGAATAVMITGSAYAIFGVKAHPERSRRRPRPGRWPRPSSCSSPPAWPRSSWSSRPVGCSRPGGARPPWPAWG